MTTSLSESLAVSVGTLAVLRESVKQRTEKIAAARKGFDATIADDLQKLEADKRALEAEESAVRGIALVEYENTGTKAPATGVMVVMTKEYAIDEVAGFAWAQAHGLCLIPAQLDKKAAQKMATVQPLPFVTVTEVPSVRIASDLTKAMQERAA